MMSHDLPQSVPQGSDRAQDSEDRRILAIADELRRRCQLYEAELRDGESHVSSREAEERIVEQYAKEKNLWVPYSDVIGFGSLFAISSSL